MGKGEDRHNIFLRYLNVHFRTELSEMRYKFRNILDIAVVFGYSVISLICIWIDTASFIVALVNLLCLFRAFLDNSINASLVTKSIKPAVIGNVKIYNYYHLKAFGMFILVLFMLIIAIMLAINKEYFLLKLIPTISIFVVLWNDLENILIRAYNAHM